MIVVDNTEALRDWLVDELEPVCDADPVVLAKYILALVKRDKEEDALRTKCLTSLDVFLAKETPAFVDKLIHTLITQSYVQEEYDPTEWSGSINKEPEKEPSPPGTHEENDEKPETSADPENLDVPDGREDHKESPEGDKKPESKKRERSLSTISSASEHEKRSKSRSKSNSKDRTSSKAPKIKKRPAGRRQVVDDRPKRKKPRDEKGKLIKRKRKDKLKKCPDYEEKGFCKKGDSCPFDHGSDPFKVDKLPTDSFISPMFPPPFGAFPPPPAMPFPFPPPGLLNVPPPPPGLEMFAKALPFLSAPQNGTALQQPEAIRPPKRQANENIISLTQSQPRNTGNNNHNSFKRPKYVPWNKGKGTPDNTTLEIRRIPLEMNTEEKLREHFAKFGEVENVTVGIAGDQQASIIKFTTHAAARSACSAPEPVFNNRFIALFWYAGSTPVQSENQTPVNSTGTAEATAATNGTAEQSQNPPPAFPKKPAATRAQRLALARSHMLGGHNTQAQIEAEEARKQQKIDSSLKQIQAQEEARKKKEEERKSAIKLKTSLIEQKRELLSKFVEEQKKLLEKLEKGKSTLSANDKKLILSTLKSLEESCAKLRGEIDQLLNAAKPKPAVPPKPPPAQKLLSSSPLMKHKRETQKELLDAELELLTDKNAEEKLQLQKRLIELKREAVQLGVLGRGKPGFPANVGTSAVAPGASGGGSSTSGYSPFSSFLNSQYQNRAQNPGFGALAPPSHPVLQQQVSQSSPTADNRPKTIKVSGFDLDEKDEVITHFSKLGKVESKWEDIDTGVLYFEYRNRIDSLNAAQKGFKFKNKTLTVHWHRGAHRNSSASLDDSGASSLNTSTPNTSSLGSLSNPPSFHHQLSSGQSPGSSNPGAGGITNTHELARVRMESRDSSFSALMTEDDEEEAERLWRMTANATY